MWAVAVELFPPGSWPAAACAGSAEQPPSPAPSPWQGVYLGGKLPASKAQDKEEPSSEGPGLAGSEAGRSELGHQVGGRRSVVVPVSVSTPVICLQAITTKITARGPRGTDLRQVHTLLPMAFCVEGQRLSCTLRSLQDREHKQDPCVRLRRRRQGLCQHWGIRDEHRW